nr:alpha/beta hydrolase [uncultured Cellulosilyticum sp.]
MNKKYLKPLSGVAIIALLAIISLFAFNTNATTAEMTTLDLSLTENNYVLSEDNFEEQMLQVVEPFVASVSTSGYFTSSDDTDIYYEYYSAPSPKGNIVISHGFTESLEKYTEMAYYFLQEGYNVFTIDHRGHGLSERTTSDFSLVDVKDFNSYVNDLYTFTTEIVLPQTGDLPLFLYAHSMGGGISALLLEQYPDLFDAAVLSSPMMGVNLGSIPRFAANLLANSATLIGQGAKYVISHGPFDGIANLEESSSSSLARFNYYFNKKLANEYLQTNGASYSWIKEALAATKEMVKPENAARATTPILLFQSENDSLVLPQPQHQFVNNAPNTQMIFVPEAKHELFSTGNDVLIPYLNTIFAFYEDYLN